MAHPAKKTKTFDCVAFKRRVQTRVEEATRGMSAEQRRTYTRQLVETGPLAEFWRKLESEAPRADKAGRR